MLYKKGRNIILLTTLLSFIATMLLTTSLKDLLILPINLVEHLLSLIFFVGFGLVILGLFVLKEIKDYKFSLWDLFGGLFFLLFIADNWYTIATPHPLFHDVYFI